MRYAQIRTLDVTNGEGIGAALFVQGCTMSPHCKNCFNPETWDLNGGKEWTEEAFDYFMKIIMNKNIERISLLGGECLIKENTTELLEVILRAKHFKKKIWLYTGFEIHEIVNIYNLLARKLHEYQVDTIGNFYRVFPFWNKEKLEEMQSHIEYWLTFVRCVLNSTVICAGRYVDELSDPLNKKVKWVGSTNQEVLRIKNVEYAENLVIDKELTEEEFRERFFEKYDR